VNVEPKLVLTEVPDQSVRRWILQGLAESNRSHVHEPGLQHLIVLMKHPDTRQVVGGLWGRTAWDWLYLELLYISPEWRGVGWAKRLVHTAEGEAIRRHSHAAWLYSYNFQAAGLFQHLGYSIFGTLPDYPAGHQRFFLQKRLLPRATTLA
jgi:ribosomal protein S18 acetylase RimI-like enzyme